MGLELWRGGVESNDVIAGGCSDNSHDHAGSVALSIGLYAHDNN